MGLTAVRKVHDGLGSVGERRFDLAPLLGYVGLVARNPQVHIDLRAQTLADALGVEACMMDVGGNRDAPAGDPLANELGRAALLFGHDPHFARDGARTRRIDLRHCSPFVGITHVRL